MLRDAVRSRDEDLVVAGIRGAASLLEQGEIDDQPLRDEIAALLASADASENVRTAALETLLALEDPRLDASLAVAVRDAHLERTRLLAAIERLLEERRIRFDVEALR